MKLRIALYGGSFNPPTFGHVLAATYLSKLGLVDGITVCPTYKHPFGKELVDFNQRLRMCQDAFDGIEGVQVRNYERLCTSPDRPSYTIDLVNFFHREVLSPKQCQLYLVFGTDNLKTFDQWEGRDELFSKATPIILSRSGFDVEPYQHMMPSNAINLADLPIPEVSSTVVRTRLAAGQSVTELVPQGTLKMIQEWKLYGFQKSL